jgi:hypothetical protein
MKEVGSNRQQPKEARMQQKRFILAGAGAFLLVLGSSSYGADPVANPPTVTSPQQVYLIKENPFFGLHIEKAVQQAREAEIAGNLGRAEELIEHAKISLLQAREAQRAGNVAGLDEGIANLRKALSASTWSSQTSTKTSSAEMPQASMQTSPAEMPQASMQTSSAQVTGEKTLTGTQREEANLRSATDLVREARKNFSEAGGLKYKEIKPPTVKTVAQ